MTVRKRKNQLRLCIDVLKDQYHSVPLTFKMKNKLINGWLNGTAEDWTFSSYTPVFLEHISSGVLNKYALWLNRVPGVISELYNSIDEAALKSGYTIHTKEELVLLNEQVVNEEPKGFQEK